MLKYLSLPRNADTRLGFLPCSNPASSTLLAPTNARIPRCDDLATANRDVLLHTILSAFTHVEALPTTDEVSKICADEDADNDVSVVVHGEQHDKVCYCELEHMKQSADCLLDDAGAEVLGCSCRHCGRRRSLTRVVVIR